MKKSRFTEEQIAFALKQQELGTPVEEICRKLGIAQATFFNWKKRFSGLGRLSCGGYASLRKRTQGSRIWSRI